MAEVVAIGAEVNDKMLIRIAHYRASTNTTGNSNKQQILPCGSQPYRKKWNNRESSQDFQVSTPSNFGCVFFSFYLSNSRYVSSD